MIKILQEDLYHFIKILYCYFLFIYLIINLFLCNQLDNILIPNYGTVVRIIKTKITQLCSNYCLTRTVVGKSSFLLLFFFQWCLFYYILTKNEQAIDG